MSRTDVVLAAQLLPEALVEQMRKWRLVPATNPSETLSDPEVIVARLREAVEGGDVVEMRDTDLDIVQHYLRHQEKGRLYWHVGDARQYVEVYFCRTPLGEYVLPWRDEPIRDLLLDPATYLIPTGQDRVYFSDVRDLWFGANKAFIVCTVARTE